MIPNIDLGYRGKLLLAISAIGIIMLSIMTWNRILLLEDVLNERLLTRVETIGNIVRNDIQDDLGKKDYKDALDTVLVTAQQRNIKFLSVLDKDDIVLFSSERGLEKKHNPYKDSSDVIRAKNIFIKSFPMKHMGVDIGNVQIGYLTAGVSRDLTKITNRTVAIVASSFIMILLVSWIISGQLLRPILNMKKVSEKIAKGDFSERLTVTSRDVIGELEMSLNDMAEHLDGLTRNLNNKIEEVLSKTRELEESNKRLKELDRLKSEFVSIVSHELRTPLTAIIGFAKTLQKIKVTEDQKDKYLKIIELEGNRLAVLVDEFLDISKIESGNIELQIERYDMRNIIKETVERITIPEGIKVELNMPKNELQVNVDINKIKQVITNILNNALRYTKNGQKIIVSAEDKSKEVAVSITDEGPGISEEEKSRIFDKFYRGKDEFSERSRGSGLGLAIAKAMVDMHGGNIKVESEIGKGSTFIFNLPKKETK
jgi:signal transduction histidine kinase